MKAFFLASFLCATLTMAQTAPKASVKAGATAKKPATTAGRSECVEAVGLCVSIPATWQRLGNIFDDLGFVVAEPHPGVDSAAWPQISVAAIDVPAQKADGSGPSLDALVDIVLTPDGSFTTAETQQRARLLLNGANAEVLRVKLHNGAKDSLQDASPDAALNANQSANQSANQADTIEEVALIEGDEGLVYSIALRCAPEEVTRLEPVFQKAIHSWRFKPPAAAPSVPAKPAPAPPAKPTQDSDKK